MPDDFAQPSKPPQNLAGENSNIHNDMHNDDDFWELEDLPSTEKPDSVSKPAQKPVEPEQPPTRATLSEEERPSAKKQASGADQKERKTISGLEKVSILTSIIVIFLAMSVCAGALYKLLPTAPEETFTPKLPIKGEIIRISDAKTFWRAPVREGAQKDNTSQQTTVIPVVKLRVSEESNGIIRCFFVDEKQNYVGDGITLEISNGLFKTSGNDEIEIAATAGFDSAADFALYRTKAHLKDDRWRIIINEGRDINARSDDIKEIARLPIAPSLSSPNSEQSPQ